MGGRKFERRRATSPTITRKKRSAQKKLAPTRYQNSELATNRKSAITTGISPRDSIRGPFPRLINAPNRKDTDHTADKTDNTRRARIHSQRGALNSAPRKRITREGIIVTQLIRTSPGNIGR